MNRQIADQVELNDRVRAQVRSQTEDEQIEDYLIQWR